jgi:hypothetical protein
MKAFKQMITEIGVKADALDKKKAVGKPVHSEATALRKELKEGWRASGAGTGPSAELKGSYERLESKLGELAKKTSA